MTLKEKLKANNITQDEFADYLGVTRIGLNKALNHGKKESKAHHDSLKLLVAEKRGVKLDIKLD